MACQQVLARGFYALRDTWTPVWVGLLSFALAFTLNAALVHSSLQQGGLALAFSVSAWFNISLLALILRRRLKGLEGHALKQMFLWLLPATGLMAVGAWGCLSVLPEGGWFWRAMRVLLPALMGLCLYSLSLWRAPFPEKQTLLAKLRRR